MYDRFAALLGGGPVTFDLFGEVEEEQALPVVHVQTAAQAAELFAGLKAATLPVAVAVSVGGELPDLKFTRAELLLEEKVYVLDDGSSCWEQLDSWLANGNCQKLTTDSKEIYKCCLCRKVQVQGIVDDVALAGYVADPGHSSYVLQVWLNAACRP